MRAARWRKTGSALLWGLTLITFVWKSDFFLFIFQDILDEMRKELSKLKEELIDGNYHWSLCSLSSHTPAETDPLVVNLYIKHYTQRSLPSFLPLGILQITFQGFIMLKPEMLAEDRKWNIIHTLFSETNSNSFTDFKGTIMTHNLLQLIMWFTFMWTSHK